MQNDLDLKSNQERVNFKNWALRDEDARQCAESAWCHLAAARPKDITCYYHRRGWLRAASLPTPRITIAIRRLCLSPRLQNTFLYFYLYTHTGHTRVMCVCLHSREHVVVNANELIFTSHITQGLMQTFRREEVLQCANCFEYSVLMICIFYYLFMCLKKEDVVN